MEKEVQQKNLKVKIIISFLFLVVLVILFLVLTDKKELVLQPSVEITSSEELVDNSDEDSLVAYDSGETGDKYRQEAPEDIIVPGIDTALNEEEKKEIAIPSIVVPASSGSESNFRSFDIRAENNTFTPNKVIAKVGDTVHINFIAVDAAYDITFPSYGMKQQANAGQTKILEFQAVQEGSFLYYCESCGGENSDVKGNIIIVK